MAGRQQQEWIGGASGSVFRRTGVIEIASTVAVRQSRLRDFSGSGSICTKLMQISDLIEFFCTDMRRRNVAVCHLLVRRATLHRTARQ